MVAKIFSVVDRIIEKVGDWGLVSSGILILLMSFCSTYAVGRRYILKDPDSYSYEVSVIFLTACVVLAVSGLQRYKRHLRVDFIANYMPAGVQVFLLDILGPLLGLVFAGIITWQSWEGAMYSLSIGERSQSIWQEPLYPIRFVIPVSMFWLCLVLIAQFARGALTLARSARDRALTRKAAPTNS